MELTFVVEGVSMILEQIIVAIDFSPASEAARSIAASLATCLGVKVLALHVFEHASHHRYQVPVSWMIAAIRKDIDRQLAEQVKLLTDIGIVAEGKVVDGLASAEIVKAANGQANALIVMGTHARSGVERFLLGSTAEEVLRQASCPVITTGPHVMQSRERGVFRRLLYATDFSNTSMNAATLSDSFWRRAQPAHLTVLHVATNLGIQASSEDPSFDMYRKLFGIQDTSAHQSVDYVTLHGRDISQAIVNEAERSGADLIVLGVRRGAACTPRLAPKIAFQVIAAAPCAVLTISSDR